MYKLFIQVRRKSKSYFQIILVQLLRREIEYETDNVIYSFESAVSRILRNGKERMYRLCDGVFP